MVVIKNIVREGNTMRCDFSTDFASFKNSLEIDLIKEKIINSSFSENCENCLIASKHVMARLIQIQNEPVFQDKEFIVSLECL